MLTSRALANAGVPEAAGGSRRGGTLFAVLSFAVAMGLAWMVGSGISVMSAPARASAPAQLTLAQSVYAHDDWILTGGMELTQAANGSWSGVAWVANASLLTRSARIDIQRGGIIWTGVAMFVKSGTTISVHLTPTTLFGLPGNAEPIIIRTYSTGGTYDGPSATTPQYA